MSWVVILLLVALASNGITEGFHHSDDRLGLKRNPDIDWYHVFTGLTIYSIILIAPITWYQKIGVLCFGVWGLRDWAISYSVRGVLLPKERKLLHFWKFKIPQFSRTGGYVIAFLGGLLCLI